MTSGDPDFLSDLHCVVLMRTEGVRLGGGQRGVVEDYKATVGTDLDYAKYDFHSLEEVFREFPAYFYMSDGVWFARCLDEATAAAVGMMRTKENRRPQPGRGNCGSIFRGDRGRGRGPSPQIEGSGQAARFGGGCGAPGRGRLTSDHSGFGQLGGRGGGEWNQHNTTGTVFKRGGGGNWNHSFNHSNSNHGSRNFKQGSGWNQQRQNQSNGSNQGRNHQQSGFKNSQSSAFGPYNRLLTDSNSSNRRRVQNSQPAKQLHSSVGLGGTRAVSVTGSRARAGSVFEGGGGVLLFVGGVMVSLAALLLNIYINSLRARYN